MERAPSKELAATDHGKVVDHMLHTRKHHERSFLYENGKLVEPYAPAAEVRSEVDGRLEVRVRITIFSVREIDLMDQTFVCKFFLEASWLEAAFAEAFGTEQSLEVDGDRSDWRRGTVVLKGDKEHYYFAPRVKFENLVRSTSFLLWPRKL
jgi:hypothetical protein